VVIGRRPRRQPPLRAVLALIGGAWGVVILGHALGHGVWFRHDRLIATRWSSVALGIVAWLLMTMAMMGPSCLPVARYVAANTLAPKRAVTAFFAGYLGCWTGFLAVFAFVDATAHARFGVETSSGRTALVTGAIVAVAAAWQLTVPKRKLLLACRTVGVLPAHGRRADAAAAGLGVRQGLACVGACAPLMLATLAATHGQLALMVVVAVLAWLEKATRASRRVARPSAALLTGVSVAYVVLGAPRLLL